MSVSTRRELVRMGAGAAALPLLGAVAPAAAQTGARTEAELLTSIVRIEQASAVTYDEAAGRADAEMAPALRVFARQEREHAGAMSAALRGQGGEVPAQPRSAADVPELVRALRRGPRATLRLAVAIEEAAVNAYYEAQEMVRDPALLRGTASIMACQAQHLVVLRQALGRDPAPDAFVTGKRR